MLLAQGYTTLGIPVDLLSTIADLVRAHDIALRTAAAIIASVRLDVLAVIGLGIEPTHPLHEDDRNDHQYQQCDGSDNDRVE
jgi:hypothetical protein